MILSDKDSESLQFDCSRGCTVGRDSSSGELECKYRLGCCKLETYDWLRGIQQSEYSDLFEVRFKNTRKGIYRNESGQSIRMGDLVIVEAQSGHDLGIVTLEGPVVVKQIKCRGLDPDSSEFRRIYRKAKPFDIDKWQEAIAREQETMIRARQIAKELNLDMKIGDVEFQGDGTKAIFYYIADGRVDFRQLIKVYAEEFRIRIEMKQIGARQEAGLIGGLGVCGRELCCANYITTFKSITTSAARCQDLSMNPQKLAGQCGKLKCCLNFEYEVYADALKKFPPANQAIRFKKGLALYKKTDVFRGIMWYAYEGENDLFAVKAEDVKAIIEMNRRQEYPEKLEDYQVELMSTSALAQESTNEEVEREIQRLAEGGNGVVGEEQPREHDRQPERRDRNDRNRNGRNDRQGGDRRERQPREGQERRERPAKEPRPEGQQQHRNNKPRNNNDQPRRSSGNSRDRRG